MILMLVILVIIFQSISSLNYNNKCRSYDSPHLSLHNKNQHNLKPIFTRECQKTLLKNSNSDMIEQIPSIVNPIYEYPEVTSDIWVGSIVSLIPIVWATIEFTKRIKTQQECLLCKGSGLTSITRSGNALTRPRKCWSCGGFIPWLGWKMFFLGSFTDIGNGGVLLRPAKDYEEINKLIKSKQFQILEDIDNSNNVVSNDIKKENENIKT